LIHNLKPNFIRYQKMGACTSKDQQNNVKQPKRKISKTNNPYEIPLPKVEQEKIQKISETISKKPTTVVTSPSVRYLDGLSSLGVSKIKSTGTDVFNLDDIGQKRPNLGPVMSKLKGKWDHHFNFEQILIKAKYRNIDEQPAGDEEVEGLWREIGHQYKMYKWSNVKTFKFDLTGCRKITDKSLEVIANQLAKNFRGLETLILGFEECSSLTDNGIAKMFEIMCPHLSKVRRLELNFSRCFSISDKGLNAISYYLSRFMCGIKNLSLTFNECDITEKSLKNVGSKFSRRLTNLKKLNLTFNRCDNIRDDQNVQVFDKRFNALQNLIVNFKDCRGLTDKILDNFGSQLSRNITTLRQLSMNFNLCDGISDKGLESFEFHTRESLKPLQKLLLDFGDCSNITHAGVDALCSHLCLYLTNLEHLKLNLNRCEQLNNKTLEILADRISKIESLRHLTITFSGNDLVNDKSLQTFGEKISKGLSKIRYLDIVFAHCKLITDVGFEQLGSELKKLNGLQEITLNFAGCEKITNKSLKTVEASMNKYYVNLKKITIDMRGCKKVTYDVKDEVKYAWKYNAKLEVF